MIRSGGSVPKMGPSHDQELVFPHGDLSMGQPGLPQTTWPGSKNWEVGLGLQRVAVTLLLYSFDQAIPEPREGTWGIAFTQLQ